MDDNDCEICNKLLKDGLNQIKYQEQYEKETGDILDKIDNIVEKAFWYKRLSIWLERKIEEMNDDINKFILHNCRGFFGGILKCTSCVDKIYCPFCKYRLEGKN